MILVRLPMILLLSCIWVCACGSTAQRKAESTLISLQELAVPERGCALGGSKVSRSLSLSHARDFAITQARANLASSIKESVQGMVKVYAQEGESGGQEIVEELSILVIQGLTDLDVIGGEVVRSYRIGDDIQVVVCLNPKGFYDAFDKMNQLSQKQRQILKVKAKSVFTELEKPIKK